MTLLGATSIAVLGHIFVVDSPSLFTVLVMYQFADRGAAAARGTLIARAVPASEQVKTRSYLRAVSNIGFAVGAGLAAWALIRDSRTTFVWLIVTAAAAYAVAGIIHAFGEMGASSWSIAFELAPSNAHGQYQGLFATSTSIGLVAGSSVVAFVALSLGLLGWLLLGAAFVLAGVVLPLAFRRIRPAAEREESIPATDASSPR